MNKTSQFKELGEIEQILLRPGMWIGNMKHEPSDVFVQHEGDMQLRTLNTSAAFIKVAIDEVLNNVTDEHTRYKAARSKLSKTEQRKFRMLDKCIVKVLPDGNITIWDNGGIPVANNDAGSFIPEMIFGRLRTSSNYDDSNRNGVVGLNGIGAKATNVFSSVFRVITADGKNKSTQFWRNNMRVKDEPTIIASVKHFTQIDFRIELHRFKLSEIDFDHMKMIERKCILAAAANPGLEVIFNGTAYKFDSFEQYVSMFGFDPLYGETNDDWAWYIAPVPTSIGGKCVGLINSNECNYGSHISHFTRHFGERLAAWLKRKHKIDIDPKQLFKHYVLFINASVENSDYASQAKEKLTSRFSVKDADDKYRPRYISSKAFDKVTNGELIENILEYAESKQSEADKKALKKYQRDMKKKSTRQIPKLLRASESNLHRRQKECELYITEGDSAKSAARATRDPKTQAFYALKGKPKQTYGRTLNRALQNIEIADLTHAIGLDVADPSDLSKLRFNRVNLLCDADPDGFCIVGLMVTFFVTFFPDFVKQGGLTVCISPLWVASKGKERKFFYDNATKDAHAEKGWKYRYIKGLGSLQEADYKALLKAPNLHTFTLDKNGMDSIAGWMGKSSTYRKLQLQK